MYNEDKKKTSILKKALCILVCISIVSLLVYDNMPMSDKAITKFCKEHNLSCSYVNAIAIEDGTEMSRHSLVEIYKYTVEFDDTYPALMIHEYGYDRASKITDGFKIYTDDDYVYRVWAKQVELQNEEDKNGGLSK